MRPDLLWLSSLALCVGLSGCGSSTGAAASPSAASGSSGDPTHPDGASGAVDAAGAAGVGGTAGASGTAGTGGSAGIAGAASVAEPPACDSGSGQIASGVYTVPVSAELTAYASYPVGAITFCGSSASARLDYALPALLVGNDLNLSFEGGWDPSSGALLLNGDHGSASCTLAGQTWSCSEMLVDTPVDASKLAERLQGLPSAELQGRSSVSERFAQDPIGILSFDVP